MIRVCKAFLPLLQHQAAQKVHVRGAMRILNVTSMAGLVASGTSGFSAYGASKHAANAFSAILRTELAGFGIAVTTVNPSFHATPLVKDMGEQLTKVWNKLDETKRKEYGQGAPCAVRMYSDSCQECHLNSFLFSHYWYLGSLLGSVQVFGRGCSAFVHVGPGRGRGPSRDVSRSQVCAAGIAHWFRCALFPAIAAHAARLVPRCPVDYIWTCHSGHDEEKERLRIFVWTVRKSLQHRLGIVPRMHCLYTVSNIVVLRLISATVAKSTLALVVG
jgi:short chain dehydrogenase